MAAESSGEERTEEATQTRREDFRKRGQVAQTKELGSVLMLFAAAGLIWALSGYFYQKLSNVMVFSFGPELVKTLRGDGGFEGLNYMVQEATLVVLPVFAIFFAIGLIAPISQIGFLSNEEALKFDLNKLNPIAGLGRLFSLRSVVEGLKSIFKLLLIGLVVYFTIAKELSILPTVVEMDVAEATAYLGRLCLQILLSTGALLAVIAVLDYSYQYFDLEQKMRMTKQEVKEEQKSREGDPLIKARVRRIQRDMAQRRMMTEVPKADVIITNPTHLAVALRYGDDTPAPIVVAKGADRIAAKIREIAKEHAIPIVENKPLARALFKSMNIGQVIPRELYQAVAEVLSYVFKLKEKRRRGGV